MRHSTGPAPLFREYPKAGCAGYFGNLFSARAIVGNSALAESNGQINRARATGTNSGAPISVSRIFDPLRRIALLPAPVRQAECSNRLPEIHQAVANERESAGANAMEDRKEMPAIFGNLVSVRLGEVSLERRLRSQHSDTINCVCSGRKGSI